MPTPVNSARQCLAGDAAAALDEAVAAARRRVHAQTTSLHVVFALLSSSSSSSAPVSPLLRDAVSRARSSAYPPRRQFKALELCFGVALDRLPSSHHHHHQRPPPPAADDPPVSNSLMAAIKRSQAHQRRNPDTFHLYHQSTTTSPSSSSSSSSFTGVKVELQQLVLAILDDPVVSRVFGDAGFRSCDIKLAVLRPPPPMLRFPRASRCPPLFLCNFSAAGDDLPAAPRGFPFPFPGQLCSDGGDENCRRIAEVLARDTGRNPVLVGVGAFEAARDFAHAIEQRNWSVLPQELHGLKFASIEKEVLDLSAGNCDRLSIGKRLEELGRHTERPGVIVSIGDLKSLVEGDGRCDDAASCLVSELTRVLELQRGSLWVMARSATYETYMEFLSRYPLLDKDWDLQLLPITSLRPAMGGLLPKPRSVMETFVPFGGFLPAAYELKGWLSKSYQSAVLCLHCNDKCEQEVAAFLKGCSPSIEDQHQPNMPPWMRKVDMVGMNNGLDSTKAKDDRPILSAKVMELQKKWNDNCQRLHQGCQLIETDNHQKLSHVVSLPYILDKEKASNQISKNPDVPQDQSLCGNAFPMAVCLPKITKASQSISLPIISEPKDKDLISKLQVRLSKSEQLQTEGFWSRQGALSELGIQDGHASPSSITSVTTDLILGSHHEPSCKEEKLAFHTHMERLEDFSGCSPSSKVDVFGRSAPEVLVQSYPRSVHQDSLLKDKDLPMQTLPVSKASSDGVSSYNRRCLSSNMCKTFDPGSLKTFYTCFVEKVVWQEEAIRAITDVVVTRLERHHGASPKGDIWFSFLGPDRVGKKRAAMALAELIFGSREYLICINLGYQDSLSRPHTICDQQVLNENDVRFRGKTIVDHIAEEVGKNPQSVILLENINKADHLVQSSLSQAIQTGKISNSHGREFSINNAIFVLTAETIPGKTLPLGKQCSNFSEERILGAQGWQMKLLLGSASEDAGNSRSIDVSVTSKQEPWNGQAASCSISASKRKADISHHHQEQNVYLGTSKRAHKRANTFLDLNLPVEEMVASGTDCSSGDESNSMSDHSETWIEDFFNLMDETVTTVNFKPFDFDALADYVLKEISKSLRNAIGCGCMLEIDVQVMEQILAAIWLLENKGEINNWLEQVLTRSLIELRRRFNLSNHTVLKLVACEGAPMDCAPGIFLPSRIIVE